MSESAAAQQGEAVIAAMEAKRGKLVKAGVAVGIGSAAIVAALLYANRASRKGD